MSRIEVGARVRKATDGRAIPLGIEGTVEWVAGAWVAVAWEAGYGRCAVRFDGVKLIPQVEDDDV